ncbi:phosphopantetheine-binding protein [Scytonema sp. UIC 10036]|uniref:phosphopantetheine-binding protein n=1 Tax=Scytonema sp. UIC 10036 TaxID=2304196 RepID=UPI0012DABFAF|nr:phosphopantetheine-binding protein [Scytonema sp. UIC 10036]MUG92218.1 phosphopantetheine-binding protein [Scytonema sp. UIC 10036]
MSDDLLKRFAQLSPEKRELLEMLMKEEATEQQAPVVAPRTPVEETLANIWAQVLGLKQVGIHDHFIELGGDSIQSIKITAKAIKAGIQLSINDIFDYPTIAELATVVDTTLFREGERDPQPEEVPVIPIQSTDSESFTPTNFPEAELSQE